MNQQPQMHYLWRRLLLPFWDEPKSVNLNQTLIWGSFSFALTHHSFKFQKPFPPLFFPSSSFFSSPWLILCFVSLPPSVLLFCCHFGAFFPSFFSYFYCYCYYYYFKNSVVAIKKILDHFFSFIQFLFLFYLLYCYKFFIIFFFSS